MQSKKKQPSVKKPILLLLGTRSSRNVAVVSLQTLLLLILLLVVLARPARAECVYTGDRTSVSCPVEDYTDLVHEAVDLDAQVQKLDLELHMVKLNLSETRGALDLCRVSLVEVSKPNPWAKYGYGLGLVGAFALATSATSDYAPSTRGTLGLSGLTGVALGYWLLKL